MIRERSFVQRNKTVQLRELTDVIARRKEDAAKRRGPKSTIPDDVAKEVPAPDLRAFEKAGWVLQERPAGEASKDPSVAKVFLKPGGRLALGTNVLSVQLPGDPSEEQAAELLRPFGCRVRERLTFAPGLFRVEVTDEAEGDAVDVANQLIESGTALFAEPELIEMIGQR
jgi:hypothetical protein